MQLTNRWAAWLNQDPVKHPLMCADSYSAQCSSMML